MLGGNLTYVVLSQPNQFPVVFTTQGDEWQSQGLVRHCRCRRNLGYVILNILRM